MRFHRDTTKTTTTSPPVQQERNPAATTSLAEFFARMKKKEEEDHQNLRRRQKKKDNSKRNDSRHDLPPPPPPEEGNHLSRPARFGERTASSSCGENTTTYFESSSWGNAELEVTLSSSPPPERETMKKFRTKSKTPTDNKEEGSPVVLRRMSRRKVHSIDKETQTMNDDVDILVTPPPPFSTNYVLVPIMTTTPVVASSSSPSKESNFSSSSLSYSTSSSPFPSSPREKMNQLATSDFTRFKRRGRRTTNITGNKKNDLPITEANHDHHYHDDNLLPSSSSLGSHTQTMMISTTSSPTRRSRTTTSKDENSPSRPRLTTRSRSRSRNNTQPTTASSSSAAVLVPPRRRSSVIDYDDKNASPTTTASPSSRSSSNSTTHTAEHPLSRRRTSRSSGTSTKSLIEMGMVGSRWQSLVKGRQPDDHHHHHNPKEDDENDDNHHQDDQNHHHPGVVVVQNKIQRIKSSPTSNNNNNDKKEMKRISAGQWEMESFSSSCILPFPPSSTTTPSSPVAIGRPPVITPNTHQEVVLVPSMMKMNNDPIIMEPRSQQDIILPRGRGGRHNRDDGGVVSMSHQSGTTCNTNTIPTGRTTSEKRCSGSTLEEEEEGTKSPNNSRSTRDSFRRRELGKKTSRFYHPDRQSSNELISFSTSSPYGKDDIPIPPPRHQISITTDGDGTGTGTSAATATTRHSRSKEAKITTIGRYWRQSFRLVSSVSFSSRHKASKSDNHGATPTVPTVMSTEDLLSTNNDASSISNLTVDSSRSFSKSRRSSIGSFSKGRRSSMGTATTTTTGGGATAGVPKTPRNKNDDKNAAMTAAAATTSKSPRPRSRRGSCSSSMRTNADRLPSMSDLLVDYDNAIRAATSSSSSPSMTSSSLSRTSKCKDKTTTKDNRQRCSPPKRHPGDVSPNKISSRQRSPSRGGGSKTASSLVRKKSDNDGDRLDLDDEAWKSPKPDKTKSLGSSFFVMSPPMTAGPIPIRRRALSFSPPKLTQSIDVVIPSPMSCGKVMKRRVSSVLTTTTTATATTNHNFCSSVPQVLTTFDEDSEMKSMTKKIHHEHHHDHYHPTISIRNNNNNNDKDHQEVTTSSSSSLEVSPPPQYGNEAKLLNPRIVVVAQRMDYTGEISPIRRNVMGKNPRTHLS